MLTEVDILLVQKHSKEKIMADSWSATKITPKFYDSSFYDSNLKFRPVVIRWVVIRWVEIRWVVGEASALNKFGLI